MKKLEIQLTHKTYPIFIENGLFESAGSWLQKRFPGRKAFIITDSNVAHLYGKALYGQMQSLKFEASLYVIPAGENSKSHEELIKLYTALAQFGITRKDIIVALGGGVIGDLAGYAAATWLRGTAFVQIPTSLLAMVDSSIGGKVAVNLPVGKNLVGSFYHPEGVLIDPLLLNTLTDRHFADGMAEVIKYGCIVDAALFENLKRYNDRAGVMKHIEEVIFRCCDIKREIVEQDERENGLRMTLNFGHTFGHAIEKLFAYEKYTHGEAVSMGMVFISELSHKLAICDKEVPEKIRDVLIKYHLPVNIPHMDKDAVVKAVLLDKKMQTDSIHLVMIKKLGEVVVNQYSKDRMRGWIHEKLND